MPLRDPEKRKAWNLAYNLKYYSDPAHIEHRKHSRKKLNLMRRYGLTIEEVDNLLLNQNNRCGCCHKEFDKKRKFVVDHNHQTGKVRGLLCIKCNIAAGLLEDDVGTMLNLIDWIRKT